MRARARRAYFLTINIITTLYPRRCSRRRGHELLAGDDGARAGARRRLHATPQPHRSSAWTWRPTFSRPPPTRGPTAVWTEDLGSWAGPGPPAGPATVSAAHARPRRSSTPTASDCAKEGLQKGRVLVLRRRPRVSSFGCHGRRRGEARVQGFGTPGQMQAGTRRSTAHRHRRQRQPPLARTVHLGRPAIPRRPPLALSLRPEPPQRG